ncbi:MAG: class I SAM-dependent methyltransferase [Ilumatobacteraceae bacterium]
MESAGVTPLEQQQLRVARETGDTFWHRVRFRLVGRAAGLADADTVLDIGAGSGHLGDWLAEHLPAVRYRFDEMSPVLDAALVEHFGPDGRAATDEAIPRTTIVTMLDVLEHIEDDKGVLRSISERMAPGSQLLLTVPALQWAFTWWDTALGHHRRYSRRQVHALAESAGLHVSSSAYLFPELLPLVVLRKLQRGKGEVADFPNLPRFIDRSAELCSRGSAALRRLWPAGTSVVAVLTKPEPDR